CFFFFFQAEDGIRDRNVTGVQTCALPIYQREKSIYGAQKSMYITVFGGLSMLGGFSILYVITGTFSIQEIIAGVDLDATSPLFLSAMILILLGAFTKSAQFPFHIWLPDAMEA